MSLLRDVIRGIYIFILILALDVYGTFYLLRPWSAFSLLGGILLAPLWLLILISGRPLQDFTINNMTSDGTVPAPIDRALRRLRGPQ